MSYYFVRSTSIVGLRLFITVCLYIVSLSVYSQANFTPSPSLPLDSTALFEQIIQIKYASEGLTNREQDAFMEAFAKRKNDLIDGVKNNQFLFNSDLQEFLEGIFWHIIETNNLDLNPIILIQRSQYPNAASLGDGIFVINVGLFAVLPTKDELAFVIAHELAHNELNHFHEKILELNQVDRTLNKGRTRMHLKNMWRKGENQKANLFLRDLVYLIQQNSRTNELAADSLALHYMENTSFSTEVGEETLQKIHEYDFYNIDSLSITEALNTKEFPFQQRWLREENRMFGGQTFSVGTGDNIEMWEKDSLRTHPAMEDRLQMFQQNSWKIDTTETENVGLNFHSYVHISKWEGAEGLLANNYLVHALITAIHLLEEDQENIYLKALIGRSLLACYEAIESYDFSKCLPSRQYFESEECNKVTGMLHRMEKEEILNLTYYYLKEVLEEHPDDTALKEAFLEAKKLFDLNNQ